MYEKLKSFLASEATFTSVLVLLVGVVSFGLGRQSTVIQSIPNNSESFGGVIFTDVSELVPLVDSTTHEQSSLTVVGSRSGSKYHRLDCPGAMQIKEENKLFFDSIDLARAAGYTPAANCPDLQ